MADGFVTPLPPSVASDASSASPKGTSREANYQVLVWRFPYRRRRTAATVRAKLALDALEMAICQEARGTSKVWFITQTRGVQYHAIRYTERLA